MYLFYQHHKDQDGKVVLTELKLSSYHNGWGIRFKNAYENALFELTRPLLKLPHPLTRLYDDKTSVWSFLGAVGVGVLQNIEKTVKPMGNLNLVEVEDLQFIATQSTFTPKLKKPVVNHEDFFYNHTSSAPQLSKESVSTQLAQILEVPQEILAKTANGELKKLYRKAAMRLHPDRNNGDGSQMSELNMLWSVYTSN